MKLRIQYPVKWIYDASGRNRNAVKKTIEACKDHFGAIKTENVEADGCVIELSDDMQEDAAAKEILGLLVKNKILTDQDLSECTITVEGEKTALNKADESEKRPGQGRAGEMEHTGQGGEDQKSEASDSFETEKESAKVSASDAIRDLIGVKEYKTLCEKVHKRAAAIRKNHTEKVFRSRGYLIGMMPGYGYSTILKTFSDLLKEEQLISAQSELEEVHMPFPSDENSEHILDNFNGAISNRLEKGCVLSVDISPWIQKTDSPAFKMFLYNIVRNNLKDGILFFRVPYLPDEKMRQIAEDIEDVLTVSVVNIKPYDTEDTKRFVQKSVGRYGFTIDDDAWDMIFDKIQDEKADGYYYGIYTINKISERLIELFEMSSLDMEDSDSDDESMRIHARHITNLLEKSDKPEVSAHQKLNKLIGLDEVKAVIPMIMKQILLARRSESVSAPCMHMQFVGAPGTGKTTIARILGELLKEKGILRKGKFYEHKGRELCGKYVGHTAAITSQICKEAYGSVLFIDEAYSLARSPDSNDFGAEAIDTLIAEMENHRDDMVVILAGYEDEMGRLMDMNPGMKSRVPYTIRFENYSREELYQIMKVMIADHFKYDDEFDEAVRTYFEHLPDEIYLDRTFGNARYVRNLYEKTWGRAVARSEVQDLNEVVLKKADFQSACAEIERDYRKKDKDEKRPIGF